MNPLNLLCRIAPPVAAEVAYRLWWNLGQPEAVHARDRDVHAEAVVGELEVNGKPVVTYSWGNGRRVILLVHGWRSRASRFSTLVRALEEPGRTIIAFDAPGNGASPGSRTSVLDYAEAIAQLHDVHGEFEAIIGHSFGVLSAFVAIREGVRTGRIVGVAGMHDASAILGQFARQAGLTDRVRELLRDTVERRTFTVVDDPWARFVTRIDDPLPVLLVHDTTDRIVSPSEADLIELSHIGPVRRITTTGLGHMRVLGDASIAAEIAGFVSPVELEPSPGQHRERDERSTDGNHQHELAG
ncbi:MAG: alpha/beta fold hydrolase [Salinibacterium sp.]|nr:alpha/beta fold hydrolase [Salinibacterium sp.]